MKVSRINYTEFASKTVEEKLDMLFEKVNELLDVLDP